MKRPVIAVFDYGAGNIHSLAKALDIAGANVLVETDPARATDHDALVLPGVGAFAHAAARIAPGRDIMRDAIANGLPALGICLGMQLLFDESEEGAGKGLGVFAGRVRRLRASRVPQIGWNTVDSMEEALPSIAYFANSFVCEPDDDEIVMAYTTHERDRFASAVASGATVGVQFHPEKSSSEGIAFIRTFVDGVAAGARG